MTASARIRRILTAPRLGLILGAVLILGGCHLSIHPYRVAGESMLPTLHPGDDIFVDETSQSKSSLHDGDIILLRRDAAVVVKRILALPGETISGDHRDVFRNGQLLNEGYLAPSSATDIPEYSTFPPRTIPAGELFVMGDNRDLSLDSRFPEYAPVHFSDVVGKYTWTYHHGSQTSK